MKKPITFFDLFRFVVAAVILAAGFLVAEHYTYKFLQTGDDVTIGFLILKYLLVEGLAVFVSLFIGLIFVSRRYKVVAGTIIMFIAMMTYIALSVSNGIANYMVAIIDLAGLSFVAIGTCSAILAWGGISAGFKKKTVKVALQEKKQAPALSRILLFLSLVSVPATYIMMILTAFITIGICAWALGIVMQMEKVPVFILIAIVVTPFVGIWASARSIYSVFVRKPHEQPAVKIDLKGKPELKKIITEVCAAIKTKFPDNVILHAEPTFFVTEGEIMAIDGVTKKRTLAIGAPLVRALSVNELKAVLGHEFAHFSGNDTAYSRFVVPVYTSVGTALREIEGGVNSGNAVMGIFLLVPANFLRVFITYFATIDNILSRSRELRADWISALSFGSEYLKSSLMKITGIGRHYYEVYEKVGFDNGNYFETYDQMVKSDASKLDEYAQASLKETEEEFDSHPTNAARFASLPEAKGRGFDENNELLMRELFEDEKRLSDAFQARLKDVRGQYAAPEVKVPEDMELLKDTQVSLLREILDFDANLELKEGDAELIIYSLIIDNEVPPENKVKAAKLIAKMAENKDTFGMFVKGMALRIELLKKHGHAQAAENIVSKFRELGIDITSGESGEFASITDYAKQAMECCGRARDLRTNGKK